MILYDKVAYHNWLSISWMNRLIENGIPVEDAQYFLHKSSIDGLLYVYSKEEYERIKESELNDWTPTFTLADMIYMFNEYAFAKDADGNKFKAPIGFIKDAPAYIWTYYNDFENEFKFQNGKKFIEAIGELPIHAAATLLIMAKKNGLGIVKHITEKYNEVGSWNTIQNEISTPKQSVAITPELLLSAGFEEEFNPTMIEFWKKQGYNNYRSFKLYRENECCIILSIEETHNGSLWYVNIDNADFESIGSADLDTVEEFNALMFALKLKFRLLL